MAVEPHVENVEVEEVDVEEFAKQGKKLPKAKRYRIRIDRDKFVVHRPVVTGRQLLGLAGKTPDKWRIHQKLRGGQMEEVKPDDEVDLRERGVERFVTMELAQTDGEQVSEAPPARRAFRLPGEDEEYLDSLDLFWETVQEGKARWLLIHDHPIPEGFTLSKAMMAIRVEGGYPPGALDMVYFFPHLARTDGRNIPQLSSQQIGGKAFQRWSRHYGWREGVDTLGTHHLRVQQWLLDEFKR